MIGRTNTGGSIKLHVIGNSARPEGAGENTIWLNTSMAIPKWSIINTAPNDPVIGEVYITTRFATENILNVANPNVVSIYLGSAKQWRNDGGTNKWVDLSGEVYYSGSWHDISTFMYDGSRGLGTENYSAEFGGVKTQWSMTGSDGTSYGETDSSDHFTVTCNKATAKYNSGLAVDLSGVDSIEVVFTFSKGSAGGCNFGVVSTKGGSHIAKSSDYSSSVGSKTTATIDTSSLSGNYYFMATLWNNTNTSSVNVYEIKLV